jgi:hypothetical protein
VLWTFAFNRRFRPSRITTIENAVNAPRLIAAWRASLQIFGPHFSHRLSFRLSEYFHLAATAALAAGAIAVDASF